MAGTAHGVLAGFDGSPGSQEALAWAVREARARQEELTVCHAWAPGCPARHGEVTAATRAAQREGERTLACGVLLAQTLLGKQEVRPLLAAGPAAAVLCAESARARLLVVGSRGHSGLAGLLLGPVSAQAAGHAQAPVVVVRGQWRPSAGYPPRPVVVGADGSAGSDAAVEFAFGEAAAHGTALLAVCALAGSPGSPGGARQVTTDFEEQLTRWHKEHPEVIVRRQVSGSSARAGLLMAARQAQLLVVGSRGRGGLPGMALGSVSYALLHHAPCPVAIAHPRSGAHNGGGAGDEHSGSLVG